MYALKYTPTIYSVLSGFYRNFADIRTYMASHFIPSESRRLASKNYAKDVTRYRIENERLRHMHPIVFLGDSLTKEYDLQGHFPNHFILNRGIDGDTTLGIRSRLRENVLNLNIRKLYLMIGYNDLLYRSTGETAFNISRIFNRLKTDQIYIQSLLPVSRKRIWINRRLVRLNRKIEKLCLKKNCQFINLWPAFSDNNTGIDHNLTTDGVHLNQSGYRRWSQLIMPYMKEG